MTGSGDTLFAYLQVLLYALVAVVVGSAWTLVARGDLDRIDRRLDRLARGLRVMLRYWVAGVLFFYGIAKLFELQFHIPPSWVLDQRFGDKSPMGLMWSFMGHSRPYTVIAGAAECIGSVLLLWRRTATLGALVLAIVMTNVVAMNFCYDVPVKLWSLELLAACLAIVGPDARRMLAAALGHAVRDLPPPPRGTAWTVRLGRGARLAMLIAFALQLRFGATFVADRDRSTELDGAWDVAEMTSGGSTRWARVMIDDGIAAIRTTTEKRVYYQASVDPASHQLRLRAALRSGVLTYERRDPDRLVVRGAIGETWYDVTLVRAPPWLLETRGFHWIQEEPFNR
jgi:uncharacterized membrane protein YphA (DoxX/SURF4 family)